MCRELSHRYTTVAQNYVFFVFNVSIAFNLFSQTYVSAFNVSVAFNLFSQPYVSAFKVCVAIRVCVAINVSVEFNLFSQTYVSAFKVCVHSNVAKMMTLGGVFRACVLPALSATGKCPMSSSSVSLGAVEN